MENESKESEKRYVPSKGKAFMGYFLPSNSMVISNIAIFGALICVLTMIIVIPIPATQGFINIGDAGVMITALLFFYFHFFQEKFKKNFIYKFKCIFLYKLKLIQFKCEK